jgi:CheY-like chemotaxis protein/HPt (histidine-containing phosphotransfer) domain-containing protein
VLTASGEETSEQSYLLHLEVSDSGIGISTEDQHLIFDEFVQLDTDLTQKQRGAGLGLSIVKKLILLQDGKIKVDSTPGKGTCFTIQIPYQKGNHNNIRKEITKQLAIPSWFRKLHFLIVDDEEFNLYLIKNILNTWGVSFTEAFNGQEAVELVKANSYDLILMDIRMPIMDGYEATKQILQHRPSSRIIALTATTKSVDIQKIELAGMHSFLQKPFAEQDLLNTILKLLPEKTEDTFQESSTANTILDLDELERISGGDATFFDEMLRIFIRSSEEAIAKIQLNFQNSDWIAIAESAHKLAAPAKHLQAIALYNRLKQLENTAENIRPEEVKGLIDAIEVEINEINLILKQKLKVKTD